MIDVVIEHITNYHNIYLKIKGDYQSDEEIEKQYIIEGILHKDFITEVFSFLSFLTFNQNLAMFNETQIVNLYLVFVENPCSKREVNLYFKWLKEADDRKLVPTDSYQKIFNKMVLSEKLEFSNINIDFFNIIWNIFISINKNLDKIVIDQVIFN